jgi:hypothetical protein
MTEHEPDSYTYTLAELDPGFAVFRQDGMKPTQIRTVSIPVSQWHAWDRPTQITARMGPA